MTCRSVIGLNRGRGQFLNFLSAPKILCVIKVYFSRLMRVYVGLKVHKNENFFGFDFEFCTISLLVMLKYLGFVKIFLIGPLLFRLV